MLTAPRRLVQVLMICLATSVCAPGYAQERLPESSRQITKRSEGLSGQAQLGIANQRGVSNALGRIHVLLVCDTNDETIGADTDLDRQKLTETLHGSFEVHGQRQMLSWHVLTGNNVTKDRILKYYEDLNVAENDTLLFLFSGHGALDRGRGQFLGMNQGPPLFRSELRGVMVAQHARLAIILTDACASYTDASESPQTEPSTRGAGSAVASIPIFGSKIVPANWDVVEDLMLEATGLIDVNSSEDGKPSYSRSDFGGYFIDGLAHEFGETVEDLDIDDNGQVSWPEFLGHVDGYIERNLISKDEQFSQANYLADEPNLYWERLLRVVNDSDETIHVRLQYLTYTAQGKWQWITPDGYYEFLPGEVSLLLDAPPEGFRIRAHAIRIWAESPDGRWVWNKHRNTSVSLTDGRIPYAADSMETYTYTFN